ncbi:UDP-glucoronosyl and UDP-glucosyl transferase [Ancylostoma caninum]|uniref:UDP-glucuronosyltransferase n=1 Tax=Ancylostoma caninum TaxID=29170 RepID=A0A368FYX5_ANCCA|nr:UDP-glucoronosyl and UDP-glucosyl transferase [Ancylostoma caninum]
MYKSQLCLLLVLNTAYCYKILIFSPKYGVSHVKFMTKVADTLVEAGHDVTIYSPNIHPDARSPSTKAHVVDVDLGLTLDVESAQQHVWKSAMTSYLELGKVIMKPVRALSEILYGSQQFHSWIKHQKFDLFISECIASFDALLYMNGIKKHVCVGTTNPFELLMQWMGVPNMPSYVPVNNKGFLVPMTYLERAQNFLELTIMSVIMEHTYAKEFNEYIDKAFGPKTWSMQKQTEQCSYIFVNNDEVLDFPRVITPKFHYIGGLRRQLPKPLNSKWEKIFASAKRGVILMSFGTMARSTEMGEQRRNAFTKAFETFPDITFIWRYENTSDQFTNASNIVLHDWLPQVDMLNDKRMLAFITHGGMGGVFESAYAGVPVITIPLFADQLRNARMMEYRRVGVVVDKDDVTEDRLISAIEEILQPRHKQAAEELSKQLQNKPFTPEEVLVRHIENAIRFNVSDSLTSVAGRQSFIEYYMLDVIIPLLAVSLLVLVFILKLFLSLTLSIARLIVKFRPSKVKQQ